MGVTFEINRLEDTGNLMCGGEEIVYVSNLKEVMKERGITRYRLAKDTGLSMITVEKIERGRGNPTLKTIKCIRDYLGCRYEDVAKLVD